MQTRATQFIDTLEAEELLSPEIIEELRRQVREAKTRLKPELLAKLLVDNGHLTKFQATKLIAGLSEGKGDGAEKSSGAASDDDDLTFADEEAKSESGNVAKVIFDEPAEATPVESVDAEAVQSVPVVESVEAVDSVEVIQSVESVDAVEAVDSVEAVEAFASSASAAIDDVSAPPPKPVRTKTAASAANPWDSFRIIGVGIILSLVLIAGYFLVNWALRGSADDILAKANEAYESRSYETAATVYKDFSDRWPTHEKASFATVRSALATLRKDAEGAPNPSIGLKTAMEVLPGIADESGLSDQRGDLAGALIGLAGKFNERADSRSSTEERKELMEEMDGLLSLINDPKFVGQEQRNQQAPTLDKINEDRTRIMIEILREEELAKALGEIDEKLASQDTMAAYRVRDDLVSRYPLLESNEQLLERIQQASTIQQSLVANSSLSPKLTNSEPPTKLTNSFVLGNQDGATARDLNGRVLFAKVKGSVYGLDGATGKILWRKFVGRGFETDPVRLGDVSATDALLCCPERGHVWRVDGKTGDTRWFADFGTVVHMPVVESEDVFVTTPEGTVCKLDLATGQMMWAKQVPQTLNVPPGVAFGKDSIYLPAEHTNLYVLSRNDGECREVTYLGHRAGAIQTPPIILLGQLFVFENVTDNSSLVRLITMAKEGVNLNEKQRPIPAEGAIVVSPQIDGRRLVVQTDLGQLLVLDIDLAVETDKVSLIASRAKNVLSPQLSWFVADSNRLWVADNRLSRLELQVSMGKLSNGWSKHDGDRFTAAPEKYEDVIVHSRQVRGNRGVRVTAAEAESGDVIWHTDLGVPISHVVRQDGKLTAVNSSGMLFELGGSSRLKTRADQDPGQGKPLMNFSAPVSVGGGTTLFNRSKPNQFAYLAGDDVRIRSANFGGATPSCDPIAVGEHLAVGLDNGQFILTDPRNGALAASPFQPPMQPGKKVRWNQPAYLESAKTLVVASDQLKMFRLGIGDSLRSLTEKELEAPFAGPLVALGNRVAGIQTGQGGGTLTFFDGNSLDVVTTKPLSGRLISGPYSVNDVCLVQTDGTLQAFNAEGDELWSMPFSGARLVGIPTVSPAGLLLATVTGEVWLVDFSSGEVIGNDAVGQGLSSQPLVLPNGLLVGSDEGAVLALPIPSVPTLTKSGGSE